MRTRRHRRWSRLPGFEGASGWLNSPPLTPEGLRGMVLLVDFLTYTCINWLGTLGYVRARWERYRDQGLVVIGVHTPAPTSSPSAIADQSASRDGEI